MPVTPEIELKTLEETEIPVEDALSFSEGDFVVVRFGSLSSKNPPYFVCKIIQFDEEKKQFTGDYLRKTQQHKVVQGFVAFKYPENKDIYEAHSDDIVLKLEKPVINKGIHSFKNCFGKLLMR